MHRTVRHLILCLVLSGCASLSADPGPVWVRRVFLTKHPMTGTFTHDALLGPTTDRFSASAKMGYLYVVFNDSNQHRVQFTVTREAAGSDPTILSSLRFPWPAH